MSQSVGSYAIMLTNFDSEEQLNDWNQVRLLCNSKHKQKCDQERIPEVNSKFWSDGPDGVSVCERTIQQHPEFLERFAGILRTAFLYSPRVLVTDAELFDGVYFLAFGPDVVLDLLGQNGYEAPFLTVSGRQPTLEQCLLRFTTVPLDHQHQLSSGAETITLQDIGTLRPLQYQVLQKTITSEESQRFVPQARAVLSEHAEDNWSIAHRIACLCSAYCQQDPSEGTCQLLAQRWQEWIDAERKGLIRYEQQRSQTESNSGIVRSFNDAFLPVVSENADCLRSWCSTSKANEVEKTAFRDVLDKISHEPRRSKAFALIRHSALPLGTTDCNRTMECDQQTLVDWYQFVYRLAMADYLGCCLMAVQSKPNSYERYTGRTGGRSLMLSGKVTELFGQMPSGCFVQFCYQSRDAIQQWRNCRPNAPDSDQQQHIRNIAYCVQKFASQLDRKQDNFKIIKQFIATLVIASISVFCDKIIFSSSISIIVILTGAWFIEVFPELLTMMEWMHDQHTATQTMVFAQR
ncbi:hypothetical protein [Bifidobacterium asteroides]|uniref:hypothetical protein n=1 Tax=Bifidobacterium asteroides TaxID=1684 RepID=UPI003A803C5E